MVDSIRRKTTKKLGVLCLAFLLAFSAFVVIPGQVVEATERSETLQESYTLTVTIEGEGEVDIDPDQDEYEEGTEVTLTAIPDEVEFAFWENTPGEVDDITEEEIVITMEDDYNIIAHFIPTHDFSLNVQGNGNVTIEQWIDGEWEEVVHEVEEITEEVWDGVELRLTAVTDEFHRIGEWEGVPEGIDETAEQIEITVNEDLDITAHFVEVVFFELTIEIDGRGDVEVTVDDEVETLGDGESIEIAEDSRISLFPSPEFGWEFVEWEGDIGDENPESERIYINMDEDKTVTAVFEEENGIPGFSVTLLLLAVVIAVSIYQKKEW